MAKIGNLTGRSMADVASAIGQSLAGNDARTMHANRVHKGQIPTLTSLRTWEDYDPNPGPPVYLSTVYIHESSNVPLDYMTVTYKINSSTLSKNFLRTEGYSTVKLDSITKGDTFQLISMRGRVEGHGGDTNAAYLDSNIYVGDGSGNPITCNYGFYR